jgi:hypothetical protein
MYIPYSEQEDIILGFDGMDGAWQVKQDYTLEFQLSDAQARKDVAYVGIHSLRFRYIHSILTKSQSL